MDAERKRDLLEALVGELCAERGMEAPAAGGDDQLWTAFRGLVNTRPALPASDGFLERQDELLQGMIAEAGIRGIGDTEASAADPRLRLWRGDITLLAVDAIVNAANSQLLGCWTPNHLCIDNAIHTFAGVQLRIECARIMRAQGHDEPTGAAKATPGYNLPARRVIHTVGPIANGRPTDEHRGQLASCYRSCLDLAADEGLGSIAFCCISTGVFGFPQQEAAEIAVRTVRDWLGAPGGGGAPRPMTVVFNVFGERDEQIYRALLQ